jgi:hypothetical protein
MKNEILVKRVTPNVAIYRNKTTGIAHAQSGSGYYGSCHPNIHRTGSIRGMKEHYGWNKHDRCVRSGSFIYNIDHCIVSDYYDELARQNCQCDGVHWPAWSA